MSHPEAVEAVAKVLHAEFCNIADCKMPPKMTGTYGRQARVAVDALIAAGWAPRAQVVEEIAAWLNARADIAEKTRATAHPPITLRWAAKEVAHKHVSEPSEEH